MTTTKTAWAVGDRFFAADGEYSSNRPANVEARARRTRAEADADAATWLGWLSDSERRTARAWVREWEVTQVGDDGAIAAARSV